MVRTPSKPNGHDYPKKSVTGITTRIGDDTEALTSMTVPAKFRLASVVTIIVDMTTAAVVDIEVIIGTRLVLASRTIGLDLHETLICR